MEANVLITRIYDGPHRAIVEAARRLEQTGDIPVLPCARGDTAAIEAALDRDPAWIGTSLAPTGMPPLIAVTHSRLIGLPQFEAGLLASAALLLRRGADPNQTWIDPRWPDSPLSALYGAAGRTHHVGMTTLLLEAGANPDDNESLYHSVEVADPTCTELLLEAGAKVVGTNALGRALDYDRVDRLRLLLASGGDARERPWVHHAILRGRTLDHIEALLDAGADPNGTNDDEIPLPTWAALFGRRDVLDLIERRGVVPPTLDARDAFVAACAAADAALARAMLGKDAGLIGKLDPFRLETLPRLAALGVLGAVRTMVEAGWPLEVRFGWGATALDHAVYRGNAAMTALLLEAGADWRTRHDFGDDVIGVLAYASQADDIEEPSPRDFVGCAKALQSHGVPLAAEAQKRGFRFSDEVTAALA